MSDTTAYPKGDPIPRSKISADQMRIILIAVEHGFREHERGKNLQGAIASVYELYEVVPKAPERT